MLAVLLNCQSSRHWQQYPDLFRNHLHIRPEEGRVPPPVQYHARGGIPHLPGQWGRGWGPPPTTGSGMPAVPAREIPGCSRGISDGAVLPAVFSGSWSRAGPGQRGGRGYPPVVRTHGWGGDPHPPTTFLKSALAPAVAWHKHQDNSGNPEIKKRTGIFGYQVGGIITRPNKKDTGPGLDHANTAGTGSGPVSGAVPCRRAGLPFSWCRRAA